ncbi:MAG: repair protein RadC [Thermodesulfobacteriota bacterium]|nr:repair protein RadC [Thermodesulfobacteriota bacterium]
MEMLLTYGLPQKDVKELAKGLLREFGGLKGVIDAGIEELQQVKGIGSHTAILIKLIRDIGSCYLLQRAQDRPQVS